MLRALLDKFSGGQLTAIVLALIFVPGAVGAAVSFQPVAIVDPATGKQSYVDNGRKLYVYDPIAGYRNNPMNMIEFSISNNGISCDGQYAIPAGKALVITSVTGYTVMYNSSYSYSGFSLFDGAGCTGSMLLNHLTTVTTTNRYSPVAIDPGAGIVVPAGKTLSVYSSNDFGYTHVHGYLVPANAAPARADAPAPISAQSVAAKLKLF